MSISPGALEDLGPVGSLDGSAWRRVLGLRAREEPAAVIVEGSWWRAERTAWRTGRLKAARELGVPGVYLGGWQGSSVMYACPYGAAATAEVVHIGALVGARLAVQVGTCGAIGPEVDTGDVIIPTAAAVREGVAALWSGVDPAPTSGAWSERAAELLTERGLTVFRGPTVTWASLFAQPQELAREWRLQGYLGVDMETATTLAVASRFGLPGVSMLVAWDDVLSGRTFLDALTAERSAAMDAANEAVFEAALRLAKDAVW